MQLLTLKPRLFNYYVCPIFSLICHALMQCETIQTLHLNQNNLIKCGSAIGGLIANNTSLTDLDLSWNQFRNTESTKVAKSLLSNDTLTNLNLSWNHFGVDAAVFAIAKFISNSSYLHTLDISYNKIRERGSICVADSLKQNKEVSEGM
mgnify:CR=1 FL=1